MFLDLNGHPLAEPLKVDKAEQMVLAAAQGQIDMPEIVATLRGFVE